MDPRSIGPRLLPILLLVVVAGAVGPFASSAPATAAIVQEDETGPTGDPDESEAVDASPGLVAEGVGLAVRLDAGVCATRDANTTAFALTAAVPAGQGAAGDVFVSETEIAVPLGDLLARPHVITVDLDDADLSVPVACAAVEGTVAGGKLVVGLQAADTEELAGIVVLTGTASGTATVVSAYVILAGDTAGDRDEPDLDGADGEGGEGGV